MQRTVLFDLDGTLVDSLPDLANTLNFILHQEGLSPLDQATIRPFIGQGAKAMLRKGFEANGSALEEEALDRLFARFLDHYHDHIADHSRPFDGIDLALQDLAQSGHKLAVCTNKTSLLAEKLLRELELDYHFDVIAGADRYGVKKPDAGHILQLLKELDRPVNQAIMVGDTAPDFLAAHNAGIPVIAVSFGYCNGDISTYRPDIIIDHFHELVQAVNDLF
jgi:phosphoglycolate phosphatase